MLFGILIFLGISAQLIDPMVGTGLSFYLAEGVSLKVQKLIGWEWQENEEGYILTNKKENEDADQ